MPTPLSLDVLDNLRVATPCPMDWDRMVGDEKRRFCEHCGLHVHNTAAMTREEVLALVEEASQGGRVCARLYERVDGTLLTRDCPVGLAAARARLRRVCGRVAAALSLAISGAWVFGRSLDGESARLSGIQPFATLRDWLNPVVPLPPAPRPTQTVTMGVICAPSPSPSTQPGPTPRAASGGMTIEQLGKLWTKCESATSDPQSAPMTVEQMQRIVAEFEQARLTEESVGER